MDTLAVTLAFSAVEDIITKYSEDGDDDAILESPIARLASSRLDTELQRLQAQDKEIIYDDDYSKMPDAVKRSILNWYLEDPNASSEDTTSQDMKKTDSKTADTYHADTVNQVARELEYMQFSSASARKKTASESETADTIGYLAKPSDFVIPSDISLPPASLPQENSLLRETGINHGYTDKEIETVLSALQGPMRISEFIKALVANRKMDNRSSDSNTTLQVDEKLSENAMVTSDILVADASEKHPLDEFLASGSPTLKSKQPHSQSPKLSKESGDPQNFVDYLTKLSQDFEEEEGEIPIDELKRRSKERQKLLRDALMKQKAEAESGEQVEAILSEDDAEETEDLPESENPDNPDGWVKGGVRPKKQRRNKKKRNNQSPMLSSIQQDRCRNSPDQIYSHNFSTSPAKQDFTHFKQPNSPKKRIPNQNQQRFPSHSPHGWQRFNNQNRSPSPTKQWQSRQSPKTFSQIQTQGMDDAVQTLQHTSRQQQFNALRQQHQKMPFQSYQQQQNTKIFGESQQQQTTNIFGGSHSQRQQFDPHQQQQQPQQQFNRSLPAQPQQRTGMKGRKNLRYIIIDGSNVAMA